MFERLLALILVFAPLSLVSLGGGPSIFAEMQRQAVEVHGWLSAWEFNELFAISRAAPGPGSLISALVGWQAAGFLGALVAALALYLPAAGLLLAVGGWWRRRGDSPVRRRIERGLVPVAVGLILAGVLTLMRADGAGVLEYLLLLACTAALLGGASPYLVMLGVALLYAGLLRGGWL
ncbi:chromate transporter [Siccirubricoccus sp. KC 17139]|uniref:Chromate transporter n=1 Tax=Siccirubricoccus soli TaxID=2899147 RepID=A0ABT1D2C0_9PROT|nr:chromate transporter [Siccirubricoccus soli]MCO6415757.1 chromate transporter [Siccirubricoccus soli]MCP2681889.1 chromate transporter [Siccirubricoccus soli]